MRAEALLLCALAALPAPLPAQEAGGMAEAGALAARQCALCHGAGAGPGAGGPMASDVPPIAGLPADYLEQALRDYRDGTRAHPQMSLVALGLSDAQIAALAALYAARQP